MRENLRYSIAALALGTCMLLTGCRSKPEPTATPTQPVPTLTSTPTPNVCRGVLRGVPYEVPSGQTYEYVRNPLPGESVDVFGKTIFRIGCNPLGTPHISTPIPTNTPTPKPTRTPTPTPTPKDPYANLQQECRDAVTEGFTEMVSLQQMGGACYESKYFKPCGQGEETGQPQYCAHKPMGSDPDALHWEVSPETPQITCFDGTTFTFPFGTDHMGNPYSELASGTCGKLMQFARNNNLPENPQSQAQINNWSTPTTEEMEFYQLELTAFECLKPKVINWMDEHGLPHDTEWISGSRQNESNGTTSCTLAPAQ